MSNLQILLFWSVGTFCLMYVCQSDAWTMSYWDCDQPKVSSRFSVKTTCAQSASEQDNTTHEYDLLQRIDYSEVDGWSCRLVVSKFTLFCGSFSHQKFEKIPEIELAQTVSPSRCREWTRNKVFMSRDGEKHQLNVPGESILAINDLGIIHPSGSVSCQGQALKVGNEVIEETLVLSQYRIIVSKEKYKLKAGENVEVLSSHVQLPRNCRPKSGSCPTDLITYVWTPDMPRCRLEKLETLSGTKQGAYIVDHNHKLLIKLLSAIPAPPGCGPNNVWRTPYKDIFITDHSDYKWPTYAESEIYLPAFVRSMGDYILWQSEQSDRAALESNKRDLCETQIDTNIPRYHKVKGDLYATRRGDTVYLFKCIKSEGTLFKAKRCYADIPIKNHNRFGGDGSVYYVDPVTRIKKRVTAPAQCSSEFPIEIKTNQGSFVKLTPDIVKVTTPDSQPSFTLSKFQHEDLANQKGTTGLYTNQEVAVHVQHIREEEFREAITRTIAYGSMSNDGLIQDADYNFDISKLSPAHIVAELSLFARVDKFLTHYGAWISLIVLLLEFTKLLTTIVMIGYSLSVEGVQGASSICYSLLCSKAHSTRNSLERAKRRRLRMSRGEMNQERQELRNMKSDDDEDATDRGDI